MRYCFIGCRTTKERNARGKGIKIYSTDGGAEFKETGLTLCQEENPSFLALDSNAEYLYTVHGDKTKVSSYKIEGGELKLLGTADAGGKNPVFITLSADNRFCFVATLQGGCVSTLRRGADGSLSGPIFKAHVPGITEGSVSYPHQCLLDRTGRYLIVPIQGRATGTGAVNVYKIEDDGRLTAADRWEARKLDEPRHFALHPNNRWGYLVCEKGNKVIFFAFDEVSGKLTPKQALPTLPDTYIGEGQASAMLVHPNGRFAYASNRIHESIASYSIDEQTGYLHMIGCTDSLGLTPRFIAMDEDGRYLYAANEDSDTIRIFSVDSASGRLVFTGSTIETESPVSIVFGKKN